MSKPLSGSAPPARFPALRALAAGCWYPCCRQGGWPRISGLRWRRRWRCAKRRIPALIAPALAALANRRWPGNVRELKNVMERALIFSGGRPVTAEYLQLLPVPAPMPAAEAARNADIRTLIADLLLSLEAAGHALIQRALGQTRGNVAEAARLLNSIAAASATAFPRPGKVILWIGNGRASC